MPFHKLIPITSPCGLNLSPGNCYVTQTNQLIQAPELQSIFQESFIYLSLKLSPRKEPAEALSFQLNFYRYPLEALMLANCGINDDGMRIIFEGILNNESLRQQIKIIDISYNPITGNTLDFILKPFLENCPRLQIIIDQKLSTQYPDFITIMREKYPRRLARAPLTEQEVLLKQVKKYNDDEEKKDALLTILETAAENKFNVGTFNESESSAELLEKTEVLFRDNPLVAGFLLEQMLQSTIVRYENPPSLLEQRAMIQTSKKMMIQNDFSGEWVLFILMTYRNILLERDKAARLSAENIITKVAQAVSKHPDYTKEIITTYNAILSEVMLSQIFPAEQNLAPTLPDNKLFIRLYMTAAFLLFVQFCRRGVATTFYDAGKVLVEGSAAIFNVIPLPCYLNLLILFFIIYQMNKPERPMPRTPTLFPPRENNGTESMGINVNSEPQNSMKK